MSTPAYQLTVPGLPDSPTNMGSLSLQEQHALGQNTDPQATIAEYQQQQDMEASRIEQYELERVQQENAQMREQLGQTSQQLQQVQSNHDNLAGQVQAWQAAQATQAANVQAANQFAFSQEELDTHGDVLPLMERVAAKTRYEMQQEFNQQLAQEKAVWQREATEPLASKLQATEQQLQAQAQKLTNDFAANLDNSIQKMGLHSLQHLMKLPEFLQRFSEPFAPGSMVAWGDQLKANVEAQNLPATMAMLQDLANTRLPKPAVDNAQVPAGNGPARPMTSAQSQNHAKREELLDLYRQRRDQANMGQLPHGWDRAKYRSEQASLMAQIDAIPTN